MGNIFDSIYTTADLKVFNKALDDMNENYIKHIAECMTLYVKASFASPKKVIFNNPATIVIWNDGTKTISKCSEGDTFDKMKGFLTCYYKKLNNTTNSQLSKLYDRFEKSDVVEV